MLETHLPQALIERLAPSQLAEHLATLTTGYTPNSEQEASEPTYYDLPVLKAPVWRWEIIWYFFFGGLAAGCYIIASIAALFGSHEDRIVARTGYYLSLLALLPCPPLLIKDLGRPERFLHMLRIFKVRSPMSVGMWAVISLSFFSGLTTLIQVARDGLLGHAWGARWLASLPQRLLALPGSAVALLLGSYTGVLLTATSIPLWSRSKLLGGIFLISAVSTSTALISFVLRLVRTPLRTLHKLERLEWSVLLLEMLGLLAFLRASGRAARPLVGTAPTEHGMSFWRFAFGTGLALPWLLQTLSLLAKRSRQSPFPGLLISLLVLLGGYVLRRTIVEAGHTSSQDARTTLWNARS
ncbi:MAG: polysulfide reductase NrfD [Ktedonobacteraceae bacterium]|nr:polysulfide reductase NrfD [Ktedonobacteraceae bacterium]